MIVSWLTGICRVVVSERPSPKTSKLAVYVALSKFSNTVCQAGYPRSSLAYGDLEGGADSSSPII